MKWPETGIRLAGGASGAGNGCFIVPNLMIPDDVFFGCNVFLWLLFPLYKEVGCIQHFDQVDVWVYDIPFRKVVIHSQ